MPRGSKLPLFHESSRIFLLFFDNMENFSYLRSKIQTKTNTATKKVIIINASPRKNMNTAGLLKEARGNPTHRSTRCR